MPVPSHTIANPVDALRTNPRARQGALMVLIAVLLPVFLAILTFSINVAYMQLVRTELRAATDAAAKAAASSLTRFFTEAQARQVALDLAAQNTVAGEGLVLATSDIEIGGAEQLPDGTFGFSTSAIIKNAVRVNASRESGSAQGATDLLMTGFLGTTIFEPVQSATASFANVDICLVLDRSSSMKLATSDTAGFMSGGDPRECDTPWADSRWKALEEAVNIFCDVLDTTIPVEAVGVVTYASNNVTCSVNNQNVTTDLDLNPDTNLTRATMTTLSSQIWNGNTEIDAGIREAKDLLTGPSARDYAKKMMIVLTDGNYTGNSPNAQAQQAANQNITIHTITFSNGANQTDMQTVASIGGGHHYHAPDTATLNDIFRELGAMPVTLID